MSKPLIKKPKSASDRSEFKKWSVSPEKCSRVVAQSDSLTKYEEAIALETKDLSSSTNTVSIDGNNNSCLLSSVSDKSDPPVEKKETDQPPTENKTERKLNTKKKKKKKKKLTINNSDHREENSKAVNEFHSTVTVIAQPLLSLDTALDASSDAQNSTSTDSWNSEDATAPSAVLQQNNSVKDLTRTRADDREFLPPDQDHCELQVTNGTDFLFSHSVKDPSRPCSASENQEFLPNDNHQRQVQNDVDFLSQGEETVSQREATSDRSVDTTSDGTGSRPRPAPHLASRAVAPVAGLEKSCKDLQRQASLLQRLTLVLNNEIERSFNTIAATFKELHNKLNIRETELLAELTKVKHDASDILLTQKSKGERLKQDIQQLSEPLDDSDISYLKSKIKEHVSKRKAYEDMSEQRRFVFECRELEEAIETFGKITLVDKIEDNSTAGDSLNGNSSNDQTPSPTVSMATISFEGLRRVDDASPTAAAAAAAAAATGENSDSFRLQRVKVIETNITEIIPILSRSIGPNTNDVPDPANRLLSFPFDSPGGATQRPLANEKKRDVKSSIRSVVAPLKGSPSGSESSVLCNSRDGVSPASVDPTRNSNDTEQKSTVVDGTYRRNAMTQSEETTGGNNNYSWGQLPKDRDTRPDNEEFRRWSKDRDTRGKSLKWEGKPAKRVEERVVPTATDLVGNENVDSSEMPLNDVPASSKNRRKKKKKAFKVHVDDDDQNPSTESEPSDDSSEQVQESCALHTNPQDCKATEPVPTEADHNRQKKRRRRKIETQKERSVVKDEKRNSVDRCSETSTASSVEKDDEHISSTPNGLRFSTIASSNTKDGSKGQKVVAENRKISQKYHQEDFESRPITVDNEAIEGSMESNRKLGNCKQKVDVDSEVLVVCRNSLPTDNSKSDARDTIDSHFHRDDTSDETSRNIRPNESQRGDVTRDSFVGNENLSVRNSVYRTINRKLTRNENAKKFKSITRKNIEDFLCINDNTTKPLRSPTLA